jgi:hypothetical protein
MVSVRERTIPTERTATTNMYKISSAFQIYGNSSPFHDLKHLCKKSTDAIICNVIKTTIKINTKLCFLTPLILSSFKKEVKLVFQTKYSMCKTSAVHTNARNMNKIYCENNISEKASIFVFQII